MTEVMQGLLADAKNGRFSSIRDNISEEDIASVWENVATFIEKQMSQQKGVNIPNLGVFTFSQKKLDIGNNKSMLMQRPVFNISEKFAQTHGLHFTKYHVPGQIPVVPLNYAALSFESPFDRDTVESCIREIMNAVNRALSNKKNVELTFIGIGKLSLRDSRVKMKFYKEFINQMDGSGRLVDSLQNRPGTLDSVMSERPLLSRAGTSNTMVLPRITASQSQANPTNNLPVLVEHDEEQPTEVIPEDYPIDVGQIEPELQLEDPRADFGILDDPEPEINGITADRAVNNLLNTDQIEAPHDLYTGEVIHVEPDVPIDEDDERNAAVLTRSGTRQAMSLPKASGLSLLDDLVPASLQPKLTSDVPMSPLVTSSLPVPPVANNGFINTDKSSPFSPNDPVTKSFSPPHLVPLSRSRSAENHPETKTVAFDDNVKPASACGHPNAGQELCYLCHQRSSRNIPVSFNAERKRREEEEDLLLKQFQALKDGEDLLREQETQMAKRNDLQKIAAFNLGVADAVTYNKKKRDTDFHRSYIFQKRALTPSRFPAQDAYSRELQKQVDLKEKTKSKEKADNNILERLEQVQLAEDLAAQREQYLRNKYDQQETYKKALETQLKFKPAPIPPIEADSEVFGKNDMNNEKMAERRQRAYNLFQEQQDLVAQKKRDAILKRLAEQQEEERVLEQTKHDMVDERANRFQRRYQLRKDLESDWFNAAQSKRAHELQDRLSNLSAGILVHEQCDKYKRCKKCQRKLNNCGESNIWRESRYIPGSRLMV